MSKSRVVGAYVCARMLVMKDCGARCVRGEQLRGGQLSTAYLRRILSVILILQEVAESRYMRFRDLSTR